MICLVILLVLVLQLMVVLFGKLLIFLSFVLCKMEVKNGISSSFSSSSFPSSCWSAYPDWL